MLRLCGGVAFLGGGPRGADGDAPPTTTKVVGAGAPSWTSSSPSAVVTREVSKTSAGARPEDAEREFGGGGKAMCLAQGAQQEFITAAIRAAVL